MEELIARVSASAGIEPDVARQAICAILAFLRKEGPKPEIDELFADLPGAAEAAAAAGNAGGSLSGLMGMMGGGLMGLAARLSGLGLSMSQMHTIGHELFGHVRDRTGDERLRRVVSAIPGLSQFL
jgi:hypothetical protein